jgi:hypothetical protein
VSFDSHKLFELLPAILRIRDGSKGIFTPGWLLGDDRQSYTGLQALVDAGNPLTAIQQQQYDRLRQRALAGPLANLLGVLAEQIAVLQEDVEQLYDDQFIETCADWVAPYIGDLIGYRMLHGVTPKIASPRAEVAHTIAYRRRKGTVVVLEQLARDVTGWNATAVEFFQRLVVTQCMNHLRPQCLATPDLRRWEPLERLDSAFDSVMHTVDVRRIASQRGRYNIPNVGLFLWRIGAYPLSNSPAASLDDKRWRFHPLGIDQPLYTRPQTIDDFAQVSTPLNVPEQISRRVLDDRLANYYTPPDDATSLRIYENSSGTFKAVDVASVRVCDLEDDGVTWAHMPTDDKFVVDPMLGRIALPPTVPTGTQVRVDFNYGFSGDLGGGEYDRSADTTEGPAPTVSVPDQFASIQAAVNALGPGGGVVLIKDSGRYEETLSVSAPAQKSVEVRADNLRRPTVVLVSELSLSGGDGSEIVLSGLLICRAQLRVANSAGNRLAKLTLKHCTLVPGWTLAADCTPAHPSDPSLTVEIGDVDVTIERSILGGLRVDPETTVIAADSIIDATDVAGVAYAAKDGSSAGGALQLDACTVIGKINALKLPLVSNSILVAQLAAGDPWPAPIVAARRQAGCVRFSYLSASARVPRRYRCFPESADSPALAVPRFTSLRYGFPAYAQLAVTSGAQLLTGADNEGQPGAFNFLFQPQRETNLRARLDEYLRTGLEAGILYDS